MSNDENNSLESEITELKQEIRQLRKTIYPKGIRYRSAITFFGLPLLSIATGADPENNEFRGHAKGVVAIGDVASGGVAIGGTAYGVIALGGMSIGLIALGGLAIGALACGGGAVGPIAIGGGAVGYYACGGGAFGVHVIDGMRQSPEALEFFGKYIPGLEELLTRK